MNNSGHFEILEHKMPDGTPTVIPVYVGEGTRTLPESDDLLRAAEIIGSTLGKKGYFTLEELAGEVEEIIDNPGPTGILIEDEERGDSVVITTVETTLFLRGIGRRALPTSLISDMLHMWPQQ